MVNIVTWNVNGIRSMMKKKKNGENMGRYIDDNVINMYIKEQSPDIICLQEIKCGNDVNIVEMLHLESLGYMYNSMNKK